MGKTKRDKLRRELAQALHHIDIAIDDIGVVHQAFDGVHDDYAASLLLLAQALGITQEGIKKFWLWAWGRVPENFDSYRC